MREFSLEGGHEAGELAVALGAGHPGVAGHDGADCNGLDRGALEANAKVAQSLFQMATQGQNVAAAIFWMKVRGGWSEKLRPDPAGVEGAPKTFTIVIGSPREEDADLMGE